MSKQKKVDREKQKEKYLRMRMNKLETIDTHKWMQNKKLLLPPSPPLPPAENGHHHLIIKKKEEVYIYIKKKTSSKRGLWSGKGEFHDAILAHYLGLAEEGGGSMGEG